MWMWILAWVVGLGFAMNIGASGTAASMGAAYGSGAIRRRYIALILAGVFAFLGGFTGGAPVVKTISKGIIPAHIISPQTVIVILTGACLTLLVANLLAVPLSTSEVSVGALVGVGVAYHAVYFSKLIVILSVWLVAPFLAYGITIAISRFLPGLEAKLKAVAGKGIVRYGMPILLIGAGCYQAFAAGMNNVANAVGPLVGAGLIPVHTGLFWGALFVAIGSVTLGGRVLHTNAKRITSLSPLQGATVSFTSASLGLIASLFGLPLPMAQATTMSIFGIASSNHGVRHVWQTNIVRRVVLVWIASPASSLIISFLMIEAFLHGMWYARILLMAIALAALVAAALRRHLLSRWPAKIAVTERAHRVGKQGYPSR